MAVINYQNLPSTSTPLNATNLNTMQEIITEGVWTPILTVHSENADPTVTYRNQRGRWMRIGDYVFIDFYIRGEITALNGINNYAAIKGLPFNSIEVSIGELPLTLGVEYSALVDETNVTFCVYNNIIRIQNSYGAAAASYQLTPSGRYFELAASGWYITD